MKFRGTRSKIASFSARFKEKPSHYLFPTTGACVIVYYLGRDRAPISNRSRLILIPSVCDKYIGSSTFQQICASEKILPSSHPRSQQVRSVGLQIAKVIDIMKVGSKKHLDWEFVVIDAPDVANAFVLPGGEMCVYSGLFRYLQNEDALAAVYVQSHTQVIDPIILWFPP